MERIGFPLSRARAERTIAAARILLAASSLFAVWMDPADPAHYAELTHTLHVIYLAYAVVLGGFTWLQPEARRLPLITHIIDIVAFSIFQYFTLGPSSPFFVYFIFSLFCGTIRWDWRGALGTAAAVLTAYVVMSISMSRTLGPSEFALNHSIIRAVYLVVAGGLLVYLGRHQARLREEIERLARWPPATGVAIEPVVARVIEHASHILGARQAAAIWEAGEEPSVFAATWSPQATSIRRHSPEDWDRLVRALAAVDGVVAAGFVTERVRGRVFFSDLGTPTSETVPLTEVVAREIGASLDQVHSARQLTEIAAREERIRVARDLHDGVLQSLTGIRLEIRAAATSANDGGPGRPGSEAWRDRLVAIERAIAMEQRELRLFITDLEPAAPVAAETLAGRLDALRERFALEWKTPVTIRVAPDAGAVPARLEQAIPLMVHEAVVNALKHGGPSRVAVAVDAEADGIRIVVADDGHGFPFRGRYDHAALIQTHAGPKSLLDRVVSLGGRMAIESTDSGSRVEMQLSF
jgi:signal transduction histidine kinase